MNWNWKTGLLAQALSDYRMYLKLCTDAARQCYCLHFLQMATEKLAKGLLWTDGSSPPELRHKAFLGFVQRAHHLEKVRTACGFANDKAGFVQFLRRIQAAAAYIENLAPSGVSSPNPEYPWEERKLTGDTIQVLVHVPISHQWPEWDVNLSEINDLLRFLEGCFKAVEQLLPKPI